MALSRRKRRLLWIALAGVVALVAAGVGGYALLRSDPSWYARVRLDPARQAEGERRLLDRLASLHNAIGRSQAEAAQHARPGVPDGELPAFEIRIGEDEVNGVIDRWYGTNAGLRSALGGLGEPHVRFLKDRVELAGRSESMGALVSIPLEVTPAADAAAPPTVLLGRPYAGRLPLSRGLIDGDAAIARLRGDPEAAKVLPAAFVEALATLLRGEPVSPPVVAVSSSLNGPALLPARVERLAIDAGTLVATLRPFTPPPATQPAE